MLIFVCSNKSNAQNQKLDSLKLIYKQNNVSGVEN
jgi:hypothetical protein